MSDEGFTPETLQEEIRTLRAVSLATFDVEEAEECARAADRYSRLLASMLEEEIDVEDRLPSPARAQWRSRFAHVLLSLRGREPRPRKEIPSLGSRPDGPRLDNPRLNNPRLDNPRMESTDPPPA